jgi:hypothetical protein
MVRKKPFTREEYEKGMQLPPFNYSGYMLERAMKSYDEGSEWNKTHPKTLPKNMEGVKFTGFVNDSISDNICEIECDCGREIIISNDYITLCSKCGKGYKLVSYVAQYEKKIDSE